MIIYLCLNCEAEHDIHCLYPGSGYVNYCPVCGSDRIQRLKEVFVDSRKVLYSGGKNDECYTPAEGVMPILEYIPKGKIVWCPFDTEKSNFVKLIDNCIFSHIDNGQDFYTYEPPNWDMLISNPPYTNKRKIFERALSFGKPFAMLMSNTWLNDAAPKQLFYEKDLQLLMFDKRIKYSNNGIIQNKITFSSSYYCYNFLPKQIIMAKL